MSHPRIARAGLAVAALAGAAALALPSVAAASYLAPSFTPGTQFTVTGTGGENLNVRAGAGIHAAALGQYPTSTEPTLAIPVLCQTSGDMVTSQQDPQGTNVWDLTAAQLFNDDGVATGQHVIGLVSDAFVDTAGHQLGQCSATQLQAVTAPSAPTQDQTMATSTSTSTPATSGGGENGGCPSTVGDPNGTVPVANDPLSAGQTYGFTDTDGTLEVQSQPCVGHVLFDINHTNLGGEVTVLCQVDNGGTDPDDDGGLTSRTWDYVLYPESNTNGDGTVSGGWVYDHFVDTPPQIDTDGYSPHVPHCESTTTGSGTSDNAAPAGSGSTVSTAFDATLPPSGGTPTSDAATGGMPALLDFDLGALPTAW